MKKKILAFITIFLILAFNTMPAFAAGDLPYVVDNADLLTAEEEEDLEAQLRDYSEFDSFDIVVLTVDSLDGKTAEAYADDYYDYNGYGYGNNHDGCLFLISMDEREWHLSTTGFGITALTDAGIDYIGDSCLSDLSSGDYYSAFCTYSYIVNDFVNQAQTGDAYDYDNLDDYDSSYSSSDSSSDGREFGLGTVAIGGLIGGAVISLIVMSVLKGKMKTVYHKAQANDYLVQDSLSVTSAHDVFVTSHVTKTAKESKSSGGSSTHTGSSGTSHGGGGGRF